MRVKNLQGEGGDPLHNLQEEKFFIQERGGVDSKEADILRGSSGMIGIFRVWGAV